jgi:uncharacterized protein YhfF
LRSPDTAIEAFAFGDDREMADRLVELVLDGTKTATSSLAWEYDGPAPAVGDLAIVVDGDGRPRCIIETTEVYELAFDEVDEAMAYDEGEGDRSLVGWREEHWTFFGRVCVGLNREPSGAMPIVFERFQVVYRS